MSQNNICINWYQIKFFGFSIRKSWSPCFNLKIYKCNSASGGSFFRERTSFERNFIFSLFYTLKSKSIQLAHIPKSKCVIIVIILGDERINYGGSLLWKNNAVCLAPFRRKKCPTITVTFLFSRKTHFQASNRSPLPFLVHPLFIL